MSTNSVMTADDVQALNIWCKNFTTMHRDESGRDWDAWYYYPTRGTPGNADYVQGHFSDGHDYAGSNPYPTEGWTVVEPTTTHVKLPIATYLDLIHELEGIRDTLDKVSKPKKQADRESNMMDMWRKTHDLWNKLWMARHAE